MLVKSYTEKKRNFTKISPLFVVFRFVFGRNSFIFPLDFPFLLDVLPICSEGDSVLFTSISEYSCFSLDQACGSLFHL